MTSRTRRRLIVAAVLLVVLNIGLVLADELLPAGFQAGPAGSSFSTQPAGTAAFAALLERNGQPVRQVTKTTTPLDPADTVILLEAPLFLVDTERLGRFVEAGGRMVVSTRSGQLADLIDPPPVPDFGTTAVRHEIAGGIITPGTGTVEASVRWLWQSPGSAEVLAGDAVAPLAIRIPIGDGDVIALADPRFLDNAHLDRADNAAFAVALTDGRATDFLEYPHGFTTAFGGAEILTGNLRWALVMLVLAGLTAMVGVGVRWRPPERTERILDPSRGLFVEAVGDTLARTDPSALEPLQASGRRLLAARLGMSATDPPEQLVAASAQLGIPEDQAAALFRTVRSDADAWAAGAAHASLYRSTRGGEGRAGTTTNVSAEEGRSATPA